MVLSLAVVLKLVLTTAHLAFHKMFSTRCDFFFSSLFDILPRFKIKDKTGGHYKFLHYLFIFVYHNSIHSIFFMKKKKKIKISRHTKRMFVAHRWCTAVPSLKTTDLWFYILSRIAG